MNVLTELQIALKKLSAVVIDHSIEHSIESTIQDPQQTGTSNNDALLMMLNAQMTALGFIMSKPLYDVLSIRDKNDVVTLYPQLIKQLKALKGADVTYQPMYPNFPQQVIDESESQLYFNALLHYWTDGLWRPEFAIKPRAAADEQTKLRQIGHAQPAEFDAIFTRLLQSNDSLSAEDKAIVAWFITNRDVTT